jgi:hypothetical protein
MGALFQDRLADWPSVVTQDPDSHSDLVENSVSGYSPDSKDVSTEDEESSLLETVTRKLLVKHCILERA